MSYIDGWAYSALNQDTSSYSSGGSLDWLNSTLDNLGGTAVKVLDTKTKIDAISKQSKTQKAYENANQTASQPIGAKNLISGIDNNILLVGAVGFIGVLMLVRG